MAASAAAAPRVTGDVWADAGEGDRGRITAAIRDVERQTSGELVTVIARASDGYAAFPLLAAAFLALLAPAVAWIVAPALDHLDVYAIQLGAFIAIAAPALWRPLRMRLVPLAIKRRRAGRLAQEQFHALGLDQTRGRTGILLFVSVAERYVEILADRGIDEKVPPGTWKAIVAVFTRQVREGKIADGFVGALGACGALLISHFPRADDDRNELPDVLIEL